MKSIRNIVMLSSCIILMSTIGWGAEDPFEPWGFDDKPVSRAAAGYDERSTSLAAQAALEGLNFFSEHISAVDGDRCPMYPTCAAYSRQVFRKHGFFVGIVMTADRLIHESDEMRYVPRVRVGDRVRYLDPVSENDFWWYGAEGLDK